MKQENLEEFQWSLSAVLEHAENKCRKGSYELKQTQLMHASLRRQWKNLRDGMNDATEQDNT